ncbi:MAG TPA: PQQ-binding-like beta-propeller repeat protein, partial [Longimicrobiaceae bacterium]|nr:PQQ-binding-like beta-propeller repeat protein [Longimicrobiaceae bacterium]
PGDLSPGRAWEAQGKLAGSVDYTFSGRVLEAGPFRGETGRFADCRRIETRLVLVLEGATLSDETWRGWHCAGVGVVEEETYDAGGKRTGVRVAVAADGIRTPAALIPPPAPVAAGPVPAAPAGGEWHLTRVARIGQTVNASESTIPPVWIPGEPAALLVAGQGSDLTAYDAGDPTGKVLWRFHPGGTVYSPPAHDPRTGRIYFGASDKRLYALDSRGLFLWSFRTGDNVATRPAVADGVVVFGSEDRTVYGVDAATGALRWKWVTGGPVVSSPVVVGSTVVIGSDDGAVYALDVRTGAERWTVETGDAVEAPVVAAEGVVYIAGRDKTLRALDPRTGDVRWTAQVGNVVRSAAAAGPAGVYVVDYYGYLKAFDRRSGRRFWTSPTDGYTGPAAVVGGELFVARSDGSVHRVDARSGRRLAEWRAVAGTDGRSAGFYLGAASGGGAVWLADFGANVWRLGPGTGGARPLPLAWSRAVSEEPFEMSLLTTTPVRWGARTLLLDRSNHLYELDAATGRAVRLGRVGDDRSAMVEPTVAGGTLLVPAGNTLFAARLPDGRAAWSFRGEGTALAPAVVAGGTVLWTAQRDGGSEGNESGTLYAVELATGRLRWSHPVRGVGTVGGVVVRGGTVYLGTPATALDLATGRVLWTARSAEVPVGNPALAERGDVVYTAALFRDGTEGSVSALGVADGRVLWRRALGKDEVLNFLERIWTAGDLVVVPSLSGRVIALDAATGAERWRYAPDAPRLGGITVDGERTYLALQNGQVVVLETRTGRPLARFSDLELNLSGFSYAERPVRVGDRLVVATGAALLGFDVSPR